jgi:soluble lytic murein transglycosylase-like protein
MTDTTIGGIGIKLLIYLVSTIIVLTVWIWFATITVKWKDRAQEFGQAKLLQARSYVLTKLDAPTDVVISQPASQASVDELIQTISVANGISPVLVRSLVKTESTFRQEAIGFNPGLEAKGFPKMVAADHSYMQVSGRWAGHPLCPDVKVWSELYDPKKNITCGVAVLKDALNSAKSVTDALSIYNCGKVACEKGQHYASLIAVDIVNSMRLQ